MNVLVMGSGGREHVLSWKLAQSPRVERVWVAPGNGGTVNNVSLSVEDHDGVVAWCGAHGVDLVVVGPEAPLASGLADALRQAGVRVFGPSRRGAMLESSKVWAKDFMARHGVATAPYRSFARPADAHTHVSQFAEGVVIKLDGLAAGKGVEVCHCAEQARAALSSIARRYGADAAIVVEERLVGRELSILGFTDGTHVRLLAPSQDHKQLLDGDRGPNTGGMGAFSPVPFCDATTLAAIERAIIAPTVVGLREEHIDYCGVLYFGVMLAADGPKLLEINVRFGDPEAEVVLPGLRTDLCEVLLACTDGGLAALELEQAPGTFVDVVLASGGYPDRVARGCVITGLDDLDPATLVFHAGTQRDGDRLVTSGGRVLNVVCWGATLHEAIEKVYDQVACVAFEGMTFRTDIGRRGDHV